MREGLVDSFRSGCLNVYLYRSRRETAAAAGAAVALKILHLIGERNRAVGLFAAALSEAEIFDQLVQTAGIEWTRVIGFHLGEYLGIEESAPDSSRRFLIERLVKRVPLAEFHPLRGEASNPEAVCLNYAALLGSRPPDFALLEIGADGRLAHITPPACDFKDPAAVKIVEPEIDGVPRRAISLTIPAIISCRHLFAVATGPKNRRAVYETIEGGIAAACPASILRTHPDAHLFLDSQAAAMLSKRDLGWES